MGLTVEEIHYILGLISASFPGRIVGYSDDPLVGKLQAKLSMMLEAKARVAAAEKRNKENEGP